MLKKSIFLFLSFTSLLFANFEDGKKLFEEKCSSCHKEYISFDTLKINFFERKNKLLNLTIPTENMLAWAIMDSGNKIGDPEDPEMRVDEIAIFLQEYLAKPDLNNSVCDNSALKYYEQKKPMQITEDEAEILAYYFMGYKEDRLKNAPKKEKNLSNKTDDEKILNQASREGKHIIVYTTSETCYYCKKMDREVLALKDVQEIMNKDYIFLKIDVDHVKIPFGLKKHFKGMTPTFFILTSGGELISTYPGSWNKSDYLKILEENL